MFSRPVLRFSQRQFTYLNPKPLRPFHINELPVWNPIQQQTRSGSSVFHPSTIKSILQPSYLSGSINKFFNNSNKESEKDENEMQKNQGNNNNKPEDKPPNHNYKVLFGFIGASVLLGAYRLFKHLHVDTDYSWKELKKAIIDQQVNIFLFFYFFFLF